MPYKMKKVDGFSVSSPSGTKAKNTTKAKAMGQMRLLRGVEHGMVPKEEKKMMSNMESHHYSSKEGKNQRDGFYKRKKK